MKKFGSLSEIRYSQVKPEGWLKNALVEEKNGFPGNLESIGYPFDTMFWEYKNMAATGYDDWWPYEQTAYWIDGMVRAAGILEDEELYDKVKRQLDFVLESEDTFIGPVELKESRFQRCNRWPVAVLSRALYARWSLTGDENYLVKLRDHYLNDDCDYSAYRDITNIETIFKLYEYFKDERLYEKAVAAYESFEQSDEKYSNTASMAGDTIPHQHGVTYNEQAKLAAIMYMYTGEEKYLTAAQKGYDKIDQYHMLPDGVHCSCEFTEGNETKWVHESCVISDYTWSMGYLLEATGSSKYADKIERAFLNAAFGAIGPYFKTFQYFSAVNQTIAARNSTNTNIKDFVFTPRMAFQPCHYPECCAGNIGRVIPNYVLRMYQNMKDGICVSLYGDSTFDGDDIKLVQTGGYPFGDTVKLNINLKKSQQSKLKLRIPCWAKAHTVRRNGEILDLNISDGYITLNIFDGDTVELSFQKEFVSRESPDGGVYFEYGPFLLSLKIDEKWEIDQLEKKQTAAFPAYNVYAASAWNYCVNGQEIPKIHMHEITDNPFWEGVPFEITIDARVLKSWELVREQLKKPSSKKKTNDADKQNEMEVMKLDAEKNKSSEKELFEEHITTPELPDAEFIEKNKGELERITLIPYGCSNLRITVFPKYH